jgi:geranylgeranyl diphosphate synthase type II
VGGELWADLKDRQDAVEAALRLTLARFTSDAPAALSAAMGYSLLAPGKRLRPLLVALACEAAGGTTDQALPAACAVEMVHTYSLVHDDLPAMDDDDLRRGLPTCHKKYGEALAILAGDALLTLAFEVIGTGYPPRTAAVSCVELAAGAGALGMVGGQVLDLEAEGRIEATGRVETAAHLETIHRRKTGALFRASLRLGVHAAQGERGTSREALAAANDYAAAFGLAFQVTDDLLDVESTAEKAGKRVNKDAARGKLTYPGLLGVAESRRKAEELGKEAVGAALRLGSAPLARLARYVVERDR